MSPQERRARMDEMVSRWKSSGISQTDFARENNLQLEVFRYWIYKHRKKEIKSTSFVQIKNLSDTTGILIRYPNGVELRLPVETPIAIIRSLISQ